MGLPLGLRKDASKRRVGRTLELLLLSPMSLMSLLIGTAMVQMLNSSIDVVWMLFVGRFLFRIELAPNADFTLAALGALTAVISMASFGMFFAAIALTTRHAWVIQSTLNQLFQFLGGMFFPVELLHELSPTLYQICSLFPVTQALNVTRNPLLMAGTTLQSLQYSYLILITESVLFFSSGYILLRYMRKVAKERGTYLYV